MRREYVLLAPVPPAARRRSMLRASTVSRVTQRARVLRRRRAVAMSIVGATIALIWVLAWPYLDRSNDEPEQPEVTLSGNDAQLFGQVLDAATKKGLADAVVSIEHAGGRATAAADEDGRFSAVIDASRPVALTIDAPDHRGAVAFGRLCRGERRRLSVSLTEAALNAAPPAPIVLQEKQCH